MLGFRDVARVKHAAERLANSLTNRSGAGPFPVPDYCLDSAITVRSVRRKEMRGYDSSCFIPSAPHYKLLQIHQLISNKLGKYR